MNVKQVSDLINANEEKTFLTKIDRRHGKDVADAVKGILEWSHKNKDVFLRPGTGDVMDKSFAPSINHKGQDISLVYIWETGSIYLPFYYMRNMPFFNDKQKCALLVDQVQAIPVRVHFETENPKIDLRVLRMHGILDKFLDALDWLINEIKKC